LLLCSSSSSSMAAQQQLHQLLRCTMQQAQPLLFMLEAWHSSSPLNSKLLLLTCRLR
jgi:hypothetical protein